MTTSAYLVSAIEAEDLLTTAIAEAYALLPEFVRRRQWMFAQHNPTPWASLHYWYLGIEDSDPEIAAVLAHLVMLSDARANLRTVTLPRPHQQPDLTLAKGRRTA